MASLMNVRKEQAKEQERKYPSESRRAASTKDIVYTGVFVVLTAVCSWISIPTSVPFTLQTFAVFTAVLVLGGKRGTMSIAVYLLLGTAGVPVFANFTSGPGILLGSTGGYLIGFILTALVMWVMEPLGRKYRWCRIMSMILGLTACYAAGTAWFMAVYGRTNGPVSLMTVLGWCVFPFVIPDLIKAGLALTVSPLIRRAEERL